MGGGGQKTKRTSAAKIARKVGTIPVGEVRTVHFKDPADDCLKKCDENDILDLCQGTPKCKSGVQESIDGVPRCTIDIQCMPGSGGGGGGQATGAAAADDGVVTSEPLVINKQQRVETTKNQRVNRMEDLSTTAPKDASRAANKNLDDEDDEEDEEPSSSLKPSSTAASSTAESDSGTTLAPIPMQNEDKIKSESKKKKSSAGKSKILVKVQERSDCPKICKPAVLGACESAGGRCTFAFKCNKGGDDSPDCFCKISIVCAADKGDDD